MTALDALHRRGWVRFGHDPAVAEWARAARPVADEILADPQARETWMRCGGTWFAGVNIFPNDRYGRIPGRVPAVSGPALKEGLRSLGLDEIALDTAQISVCFQGYPKPSEEESEANYRFRKNRDAAHIDGLLRDDARRRSLGEVHGFVLGLPLSDTPEGAAPLVVWEGSHEIVRSAFRNRLGAIAPEDWSKEDLTDIYVTTRRRIFDECRRVTVHARPGEAYLIHRLALHGVAPWRSDGGAAPRIIAYFRPDPFPGSSPEWWLNRP
ncbi:MAG: hypothetical protein AAF334_11710 [Pseudomonadota bacterium]